MSEPQSQDYFAPYRFDPPTKQKRPLRWILLLALLLLAAACTALLLLPRGRQVGQGFIPRPLAQRPDLSLPLPWRVLITGAEDSDDPMLGDFDGDGADELLCGNIFVQQPKSKGTATIEDLAKLMLNMREDYHWVELDGTIRTQRRAAWMAQWDKTGWDFDGDGVDEVVRRFMDSTTSFCKPDGSPVGKLEGQGLHWQDNQADFNGDGKMDIVLRTDRPDALLIYAHDGKQLGKFPYPDGWTNPVFGHFKDKNKAVALFTPDDGREGANQEFLLVGLEGKPQPVTGYPLDIWQSWPADCGDLNGDGYDEVLAQNAGYFDLKHGNYVAFQNPQPSYYEPYYLPGTTIACDISGDGKPELISALTEKDSAEYDDVLLVAYDLQGKAVYTERMNWFPIMMKQARDSAGLSYLILAGHEEVRIVP